MSWTIDRHGRTAVVTMNTNPVNAQNRAFFADLHDAFDRLERDHLAHPNPSPTGSPTTAPPTCGSSPTRGPLSPRSTAMPSRAV